MILLNKAKNYITNGAFDYWNRGTSFAAIASSTYFADRFQYSKSGTMVQTVARDTDVPTLAQSSFSFPYSALFTLTQNQPSLGASDYAEFHQKIEGQFFAPLKGKPIVISFWVKSNVTGVLPVSIHNTGETRSYVSTYTILVANTWEKKSVSLTHDVTGTWLTNTGIGLTVTFTFAAGTTYNAPALNTWYSAYYHSHTSCLNTLSSVTLGAGSTPPSFRFTGLQVEEGIESSNFERMAGTPVNELILCQRYYYNTSGTNNTTGLFGVSISTTQMYITGRHPVAMRATPTMSGGASGTWTNNNGTAGFSSTNVPDPVVQSSLGFVMVLAGFSGMTPNQPFFINSPTTGYITADVEL